MPIDPAAFRHHPDLAEMIAPPAESFFRTMDPSNLDAVIAKNGGPSDWRHPDATRAQLHRDFLATCPPGDLWVFGYGSLMWDPALMFSEVRHATVPGLQRALCLVDRLGGRGSPEKPGVLAGLVSGGFCEGLAFRIPEADIAVETEILWRREMIAPAYVPVFVAADTAQGSITALTFVADLDATPIEVDLPRDTIVQYLATGEGVLGTSLDYLKNLLGQFATLGVADDTLAALYADARAKAGSVTT